MNCGGNTLDLLTATRAASPSRWESLDKMGTMLEHLLMEEAAVMGIQETDMLV